MNALGRLDVRGDVAGLLLGAAMTGVVVLATTRYDSEAAVATLLALAFFAASTTCFLARPHVAVAITIPLFAAIPTLKVLVGYWMGPVKDAVTLSAALAAALFVLQRDGRRKLEETDKILLGGIALLVALYVLDAGGLASSSWRGEEWLHGLRLMGEPFLLLLAGLLLPRPQKTLGWAASSIIVTGCAVAAYGIVQQFAGHAWLNSLGYSYDQQIETVGSRLRSFGTLDDAFAYAALLSLAFATTLMWMRRSALAWACRLLIAAGIVVSFVQTAAIVVCTLLALWFLRSGRTAGGVILFLAALATGITLALAAAPATEEKTVRVGPSTYLTLNGRTSIWATVFADHSKIPLGQGVGAVGRASQRARIGITDVSGGPGFSKEGVVAVDSGYFAAVADVGLAGLAALLLLLGRIVTLGSRATRLPGANAGWLCLAYVAVLMVDALTRDSFTGFPNAYLGFLLIGLTLAVARDAGHQRGSAAVPPR